MLKNGFKRSASASASVARVPRRAGHVVGSIVGSQNGQPLVTYPGNPSGPLLARATVVLPSCAREGERASGTFEHAIPALLVFEEERNDRPIVVGLLQDPSAAGARMPPPLVARVDGKRVVIEADDEIELRCGKASIVLRKNGRLLIRGAYVETRAEGVNRIRGGSVQIN